MESDLNKKDYLIKHPSELIASQPEMAWKVLKTLHDDKEALKEEVKSLKEDNKVLTQQIEYMRSKYNIL